MNWINSVVRPKIRNFLRKKEMPENLWVKCPETGQMIYYKDLEANQFVVPGSNYHMRMAASARLKALFDNGEYETLALPEVPHVQVDWLRYGPKLAQVALTFGADDVDNVSASDDGPEGRRRAPVEELKKNIESAGFAAVERDGRFVFLS